MNVAIEGVILARLRDLIRQADSLARTNEHGQATSEHHLAECRGWIAAARHAVKTASGGSDSAYAESIEQLKPENFGYTMPSAVRAIAAMLRQLISDIDAGLLGSITDRARAETFDDFLDHGHSYLKDGRTREAGVIVGVVFEDAVRRISRKLSIPEAGVKLDALITDLVKHGAITELKAKRARVAAGVRTKATHAQWDEFSAGDVEAALTLTRELVDSQLVG